MSFGNDGRDGPPRGPAMWVPQGTNGPGWGSANPPQQPQPLPPTQAQPVFPQPLPPGGFAPAPPVGFAPQQSFAGGAGPTGNGLPPGAAEAMFEVDVPYRFVLPQRCACCAGPSNTVITAKGQARAGRTVETRTMNVPYCWRCAQHVRAGRRRGILVALLAITVGTIAAPLAMNAWEFVPAWLFMTFSAGAALAALALLAKIWAAPQIRADLGCSAGSRPAAWIDGFGFRAPTMRARFTHGAFASETAQIHSTMPRAIGQRKASTTALVVVPITALVCGIPTYFGTHGHVYFDNPTRAPLTFILNDGQATISVRGGGHESLYVPAGEVHVAVQSNGATLESFDGDLEHGGQAAVTPFGTACYARIRHVYGTASGASATRAQPGTRWHNIEGVDFVFEASPHTVEVSQGETGATRVQFVRVNCETGSIQY